MTGPQTQHFDGSTPHGVQHQSPAHGDEWVSHDGGACPVPLDSEPAVRFRDGDVVGQGKRPAGFWRIGEDWWRWQDAVHDRDIVAYRLAAPSEAPAPTQGHDWPTGAFTDANGKLVKVGDKVEYQYASGVFVVRDILQDGDAQIENANGIRQWVKWVRLCADTAPDAALAAIPTAPAPDGDELVRLRSDRDSWRRVAERLEREKVALTADKERLERERDEALGNLCKTAFELLDAEAALATAQAENAGLRAKVVEAIDLLMERTYGSPARSPGHNARLVLQRALAAPPDHASPVKPKPGDRVLVSAIVASVFDGPTNWPVKIVLDHGTSGTVDSGGSVHYSALRGIDHASPMGEG